MCGVTDRDRGAAPIPEMYILRCVILSDWKSNIPYWCKIYSNFMYEALMWTSHRRRVESKRNVVISSLRIACHPLQAAVAVRVGSACARAPITLSYINYKVNKKHIYNTIIIIGRSRRTSAAKCSTKHFSDNNNT